MIVTPDATADTIPDADVIVATDVLDEDHVPPVPLESVAVVPTHTFVAPVMAVGIELTVITAVV